MTNKEAEHEIKRLRDLLADHERRSWRTMFAVEVVIDRGEPGITCRIAITAARESTEEQMKKSVQLGVEAALRAWLDEVNVASRRKTRKRSVPSGAHSVRNDVKTDAVG